MRCLGRPICSLLIVSGAWLGLFLISVWSRPALPVDETRYLSVAWEMWINGDYLVPHRNGEPYHHKPPLLFWLINASWWVFGVSDWAARLVTGLAGLLGAWLALPLARQMWPAQSKAGPLAVWVLFTGLMWLAWTTVLMFDLLVAVFAQLALLGVLLSWRGQTRIGWALTGLGLGLGVLTKGPVILVYVLPVALSAPLWMREQRPASWWRWYGGILSALLLGAGVALAWALPAAFSGGDAYREALLWGQTANRMVESFAHQRPFWWYLPALPVLLYPWSIWGPVWRSLRRRFGSGLDSGERLALIGAGSGLLIFSMISGKQLHYLLPLFPLVGLLAARAFAELPQPHAPGPVSVWAVALPALLVGAGLFLLPLLPLDSSRPSWMHEVSPLWGLLLMATTALALFANRLMGTLTWPGVTMLCLAAVLYAGFVRDMAQHYDIDAMAAEVATAQEQGRPVAFIGGYHGEFNVSGRLRQPVTPLLVEASVQWAVRNPNGVLAVRSDTPPAPDQPGVIRWEGYRSDYLLLWQASAYAALAPRSELDLSRRLSAALIKSGKSNIQASQPPPLMRGKRTDASAVGHLLLPRGLIGTDGAHLGRWD